MAHHIKILLVDDNPEFIKALRTMIEELLGSAISLIEYANNGVEAIEKLKKSSFDYIFIDVFMPILDGIETLRIINKDFYSRHTVVIAVSFNSGLECMNRVITAGAKWYLRKDEIEPGALAHVLNLKAEF